MSIFAGRIADEGNDPAIVIRNVRRWLDEWGCTAEIIVGSIRTAMDIQSAALAGAHVVTIPPQFLPKIVDPDTLVRRCGSSTVMPRRPWHKSPRSMQGVTGHRKNAIHR